MQPTDAGCGRAMGMPLRLLLQAANPWHDSEKVPAKQSRHQKLCEGCGKVEVTGIKRFCPKCAKSRNRESYRGSKAKRRSRVQKTGFSPIQAEALTNAL